MWQNHGSLMSPHTQSRQRWLAAACRQWPTCSRMSLMPSLPCTTTPHRYHNSLIKRQLCNSLVLINITVSHIRHVTFFLFHFVFLCNFYVRDHLASSTYVYNLPIRSVQTIFFKPTNFGMPISTYEFHPDQVFSRRNSGKWPVTPKPKALFNFLNEFELKHSKGIK